MFRVVLSLEKNYGIQYPKAKYDSRVVFAYVHYNQTFATCHIRAMHPSSYLCKFMASLLPKTLFTPLTSRYIKRALQLLNQRPLLITNIRPVKLLQRIDTLPRDQRVQRVLFFPMSAVDRLVGSFDLDRDGGLAALDHGDLFVVTLD